MDDVRADHPEVSGKVFRFLSAMHPALSKAERKRYAGFDPEKWYDWTPEISQEFSELVRRSPRDTGFARGFAYVAQKAIPEGSYLPTEELLRYLAELPAAFRAVDGSGYTVTSNGANHATVVYCGMPGFNNVCSAIEGELRQRLEASGAENVTVRHGDDCRLNGNDACSFEVEWGGEAAPGGASRVDVNELLSRAPASTAPAAKTGRAEKAKSVQRRKLKAVPAADGPSAAVTNGSKPEKTSEESGERLSMQEQQNQQSGNVEDALLVQLKDRLSEADRHFRLYMEAKEELERLRLEFAQIKAQSEAQISEATREKREAQDALDELKQRIQALVSDA